MFCAGLVLPAVVLVKVRLPGTRVTAGSGEVPLPLRGIDCGLAGALSVGAKPALRGSPAGGGEKKVAVWVGAGVRRGGEQTIRRGVKKKKNVTLHCAGGEASGMTTPLLVG